MSRMLVAVFVVAGPVALAFDADLAPFLEKRNADPETAVPQVKPVDPNAPFPKLPPVEAMLNTSAHTVSEIVQEVTKIQARVHSVESKDQARLAQKKADFEAQLKAQEQDTRDVIAENAAIVAKITSLQNGNKALRETSKNLQAENDAMRVELRSAATKVNAAGDFIKASEKSTDDRHAKVLAVLSEGIKHQRRPPVAVSTDSDDADEDTPQNEDAASSSVADSNDVADVAPTEQKATGLVRIFGHRSKAMGKAAREAKDVEKKKDDDDDDDEDGDDDKDDDKDDGGESFMQMSAEEGESEEMEESDSEEAHADTADSSGAPFAAHHFHHKSPSDAAVDGASRSMLQAVSQELKDLAAEDEQGLERQTQIFHAELAQERRAYKAALAQQRALNKTEASLVTLQSKLRRAVSHLQGTKSHLQQRVRGVGQYMQHLAHLLLAPDKEAAGLVDAMPQEVPIPAAVPESTPATPPASSVSAGAALLQHLSTQTVKK